MSNIQTKEQASSNKKTGLFPIDMSWDHMDKIFNSMKSHWPFRMTDDHLINTGDLNLSPSVDITEDKKSYEISAELPGLEAKDISLDISDNVLTVSGEKRTEKKENIDESYHVMERRYGYFKRSFALPSSVEQDKIKADFTKGILHISLPKSKHAQEAQRKIKIND